MHSKTNSRPISILHRNGRVPHHPRQSATGHDGMLHLYACRGRLADHRLQQPAVHAHQKRPLSLCARDAATNRCRLRRLQRHLSAGRRDLHAPLVLHARCHPCHTICLSAPAEEGFEVCHPAAAQHRHQHRTQRDLLSGDGRARSGLRLLHQSGNVLRKSIWTSCACYRNTMSSIATSPSTPSSSASPPPTSLASCVKCRDARWGSTSTRCC